MLSRLPNLSRAAAVGLATLLLVSACGDEPAASQEPASSTPEPTEEPTSEEPTSEEPTSEPSPTEPSPSETVAPQEADVPGGVLMVGDKSVYLDGFFGVRLPEGWSVTSADVPLLSVTPPGGETELDPGALSQSLVLNPVASPRGATFSLVHYEHSDSVPDLDRFTPAIVDLLSGDGSQIGEASEVTIGQQPGRLHQVTSASGTNGLLVTLKAGPEYFFILTLADDPSYSGETAEMLGSVSMVPEALHS